VVAFATQSNIQTTGASVVPIGSNGAGKSKLLTASELRAFASLYSASQVDTLLAAKQATLVSGTNLKSINGTTLLGSGDLTVSATPGGSSGQVQFNSAGAFGGAAALVYAGTGTHVTVTAQSASAVPFCVKGAASHTGNLNELRSSGGTLLSYFGSDGHLSCGVSLGTRVIAYGTLNSGDQYGLGVAENLLQVHTGAGSSVGFGSKNGSTWTEYCRITPTTFTTTVNPFNFVFGTSTGTKIGTGISQKIGFWNATPVVQQVLATGAGRTVDDVITMLQTLGLCKQS